MNQVLLSVKLHNSESKIELYTFSIIIRSVIHCNVLILKQFISDYSNAGNEYT